MNGQTALTKTQAETGYVLSLLRGPGEPTEAPLDRLASMPFSIEPEDIAPGRLRQTLELVLDHAKRSISLSIRYAAQALDADEGKLLDAVEAIDPTAVLLYGEAILEHNARAELTSAAEEAATLAQGKPDKALNEILSRFAGISSAREDTRIRTLPESVTQGLEWFQGYQERIRRGDIRLAFPFSRLNERIPYIFPGHCILVTAGTKIGKTAWASQVFDWNVKRGLRGIYFHFEDSPEVMAIKRIGRQMATAEHGISVHRMLSQVLRDNEMAIISETATDILEWAEHGIQVHCAGWEMEQVIRVWRRYALRDCVDFVVIDYLNKASLSPAKLRGYGQFGGRGLDAELVKTTAEQTGTTAIMLQQENDEGKPYQTRESAHKFQVWISLTRERLADQSLGEYGEMVIKNANMGATGAIPATFYSDFLVWGA